MVQFLSVMVQVKDFIIWWVVALEMEVLLGVCGKSFFFFFFFFFSLRFWKKLCKSFATSVFPKPETSLPRTGLFYDLINSVFILYFYFIDFL